MKNNQYLLFDGGMGTELYERGFFINRPFEELNFTSPSDVVKVHEDYIKAGANVITTNTFAATSSQLSKFDIKDKLKVIIESALKNANDARRNSKNLDVKIALSFGPLGVLVEPLGPFSLKETEEEFFESASIAINAGLNTFDFFILETFTHLNELEAAINGIRKATKKIPIIASVSIKSNQDELLKEFVKKVASRTDVEFLGLNCSEGPSDLFTTYKKLKSYLELSGLNKPVIIQPNAGTPKHVNGRYFYMSSPDYMAKYAKRFLELGASGVGGCCGTRPIHIESMSSIVKMFSAQATFLNPVVEIYTDTNLKQGLENELKILQRLKIEDRPTSKVGEYLRSSKKIISIEILPPKGVNLDKFLKSIELLENSNIDFINIPDGARAMTRVSSLHLASYIETKFKINTIPHFTTRDRNLIALQSDLLGAYINGVSDILLVTGDPPKLGTNREATAVYDIDSVGLTHLVDLLNRGTSPNGESLGNSRTHFGIGVASNPTAINLELEKKRWDYKVENGADFSITQPLFDRDSFLRWRDLIQNSYKPHIIGIWPLVSLRNAEFMANEVPGVHVPKWVMTEMEKAGEDRNEAEKRGKEIALKTMMELEKDCEGFCVSAPLGRTEIAISVVNDLRSKKKNHAL